MINDILDLSKIEAGGIDLESIPFDLQTLIREVIEPLKPIGLDASIDLDAETKLKGDPNHLRQVLTNLLNNALKFTSAGEVVIQVSCPKTDDHHACAVFSVTDTGIGISDE